MSSEAREPQAIFLQTLGNWHWYDCKDCRGRFSLVGLSEETPRPRACPWCGLTYTQFKNEAGEFEPL